MKENITYKENCSVEFFFFTGDFELYSRFSFPEMKRSISRHLGEFPKISFKIMDNRMRGMFFWHYLRKRKVSVDIISTTQPLKMARFPRQDYDELFGRQNIMQFGFLSESSAKLLARFENFVDNYKTKRSEIKTMFFFNVIRKKRFSP